MAGNVIFRQIPRGNVIVAGYPRTASDLKNQRTVVPPLKTIAGMRSLAEVAPVLGDAQVIRVWSGMEGYLPDMIPIIGPSTTTQGLFHAFGCCGHGFQIAPGVGAVLAEMILHGSSKTPVEDFSIHRFRDAVVAHDKIKKKSSIDMLYCADSRVLSYRRIAIAIAQESARSASAASPSMMRPLIMPLFNSAFAAAAFFLTSDKQYNLNFLQLFKTQRYGALVHFVIDLTAFLVKEDAVGVTNRTGSAQALEF
nr:FAD-binding oxidoreductase [Brucella pituitosa]